MNARDLRYFAAITRTGSLAAASTALGISQPGLTKCIDRLEEASSTPLFERIGRRLTLTSAGAVLSRRATSILREIEEAEKEMADQADGQSGNVRTGAAATITSLLMPGALQCFSRDVPGATVELVIGMGDLLRAGLREGKLDFIVTPTIDDEEFDCIPVLDDDVVVIADRCHPLARAPGSINDLASFPWVLPPRSVALRGWLEQRLASLGLDPPVVQVEVNSLNQVPSLVAGTHLLSFASRALLHRSCGSQAVAEIGHCETTYHRQFGLLTRPTSYISKVGRKLIGCIEEAADRVKAAACESALSSRKSYLRRDVDHE